MGDLVLLHHDRAPQPRDGVAGTVFEIGEGWRVLVLAVETAPLSPAYGHLVWPLDHSTRTVKITGTERLRHACADSIFHARHEVANLLVTIGVDKPERRLRVETAYAIVAACVEQLDGAGGLRAADRRTQDRLNRYTIDVLDGCRGYDAEQYARHGPLADGYSHIEHFAQLYGREIQAMEVLLARRHGELTVVDLGSDPVSSSSRRNGPSRTAGTVGGRATSPSMPTRIGSIVADR